MMDTICEDIASSNPIATTSTCMVTDVLQGYTPLSVDKETTSSCSYQSGSTKYPDLIQPSVATECIACTNQAGSVSNVLSKKDDDVPTKNVVEENIAVVQPNVISLTPVVNLCTLSTEALRKAFPDQDPFQVAKIYAEREQMVLSQLKVIVKINSFVELCTLRLPMSYPDVNIDDLMEAQKSTRVTQMVPPKVNAGMNFEEYLKTLALKKVTVTVPKLDPDIIKLWTKTHWQFQDPYSDLKEVHNVSSECDHNEENIVGKTFEHVEGHVLKCRKCSYCITRNKCTSTS